MNPLDNDVFSGRAEPTKPFRPFTPQTEFDRDFHGDKGKAQDGVEIV